MKSIDIWVGMYEMVSPWLFLGLAIVSEIGGTILLKYSNGFEIWYFSLMCIFFYAVAIFFLSISLKAIELGIAYSIWSGLGTAAAAVLGAFLFGEFLLVVQYIGIIIIVSGVILINVGPNIFAHKPSESTENIIMVEET